MTRTQTTGERAATQTPHQRPDGAAVRLTDVHKVYRMGAQDVRALDSVTIAFQPGSFWAIMGPSGSGKSTMLNVLGCLDRPDRKSVV
mgnify:FL=1